MKFAKSAAALAPVLLALAACGGGSDEADEPTAEATPDGTDTAASADTATPTPGETPTPGATPSETPSPTPTATTTAPPIAAATAPTVFNQCTACHSTDRGENGIGPSLAGVFGR